MSTLRVYAACLGLGGFTHTELGRQRADNKGLTHAEKKTAAEKQASAVPAKRRSGVFETDTLAEATKQVTHGKTAISTKYHTPMQKPAATTSPGSVVVSAESIKKSKAFLKTVNPSWEKGGRGLEAAAQVYAGARSDRATLELAFEWAKGALNKVQEGNKNAKEAVLRIVAHSYTSVFFWAGIWLTCASHFDAFSSSVLLSCQRRPTYCNTIYIISTNRICVCARAVCVAHCPHRWASTASAGDAKKLYMSLAAPVQAKINGMPALLHSKAKKEKLVGAGPRLQVEPTEGADGKKAKKKKLNQKSVVVFLQKAHEADIARIASSKNVSILRLKAAMLLIAGIAVDGQLEVVFRLLADDIAHQAHVHQAVSAPLKTLDSILKKVSTLARSAQKPAQ